MHGGIALACCSRLPHAIARMADCVLTNEKGIFPILTPDEFMAEAKKLHTFIYSHSRLCADYINQYWLKLDGRFANARVEVFSQGKNYGENDGRHIIVSDMKNGYPPDEN